MGARDLVDMFRWGSWASVCGDFIFVDKWVHSEIVCFLSGSWYFSPGAALVLPVTGWEGRRRSLTFFCLFFLEFSSTPSPKFWSSTTVNSSRIGPGMPTMTRDLTTGFSILPPGGEAVATETTRKSATMATTPRGEIVTPARTLLTFGRRTAAPEGKTESPGEKPVLPVGQLVVSPGGIAVGPVHLQIGQKVTPPGRKAGVPEKVTTPSGKMTVTPDGQAETLERTL